MNPIRIISETGKSICDVRSRDSGSFVGVSGWEGQEGAGAPTTAMPRLGHGESGEALKQGL